MVGCDAVWVSCAELPVDASRLEDCIDDTDDETETDHSHEGSLSGRQVSVGAETGEIPEDRSCESSQDGETDDGSNGVFGETAHTTLL